MSRLGKQRYVTPAIGYPRLSCGAVFGIHDEHSRNPCRQQPIHVILVRQIRPFRFPENLPELSAIGGEQVGQRILGHPELFWGFWKSRLHLRDQSSINELVVPVSVFAQVPDVFVAVYQSASQDRARSGMFGGKPPLQARQPLRFGKGKEFGSGFAQLELGDEVAQELERFDFRALDVFRPSRRQRYDDAENVEFLEMPLNPTPPGHP